MQLVFYFGQFFLCDLDGIEPGPLTLDVSLAAWGAYRTQPVALFGTQLHA